MSIRLFSPDDFRPKKQRKSLPTFLRWPDAMRLLDWCAMEKAHHIGKKLAGARRDEIIFRLGLYLGLRVSEISKLDVTDIDLVNRSAWVRQGKGNKDRYVRIPEKMIPHLQACIGNRHDGPLVIGYRGGRSSIRSIQWRVTRAARLCGLKLRIHAHVLRHSYSSHFLEMGGNIRSLQALLGHADLSTTSRYLDLNTESFAKDCDRL